MGYIYQADVYCEDCGRVIREQLKDSAPEDSLDYSSYDSDNYPKDADVEHEESDVPEHCAGCHKFLNNPLTSAGYNYVQSALNKTGLKSVYVGSMSIALKSWASWYGFSYWDAEDCAGDGRHSEPGWYSNEQF